MFEITKTGTGYAGAQTLASFSGTDGHYPFGVLGFDANGNLFGTTEYGGTFNEGTVFEITKINHLALRFDRHIACSKPQSRCLGTVQRKKLTGDPHMKKILLGLVAALP